MNDVICDHFEVTCTLLMKKGTTLRQKCFWKAFDPHLLVEVERNVLLSIKTLRKWVCFDHIRGSVLLLGNLEF